MAGSYFAIYSGLVTANGAGGGVLEVQVPAVYPGGETLEARPALPYGVLFLPEVKSKVWVQFEGGEPTLPVWTGVHEPAGDWPTDSTAPDARVLRSLTEQRIVLDDTGGSEAVLLLFGGRAHAVRLTQSGVVLEHDSGHAVTLEDSTVEVAHSAGASVVLDGSGVSVKGTAVRLGPGTVPVIRVGDSGVGNLGAPVVMTLTSNTSVLA